MNPKMKTAIRKMSSKKAASLLFAVLIIGGLALVGMMLSKNSKEIVLSPLPSKDQFESEALKFLRDHYDLQHDGESRAVSGDGRYVASSWTGHLDELGFLQDGKRAGSNLWGAVVITDTSSGNATVLASVTGRNMPTLEGFSNDVLIYGVNNDALYGISYLAYNPKTRIDSEFSTLSSNDSTGPVINVGTKLHPATLEAVYDLGAGCPSSICGYGMYFNGIAVKGVDVGEITYLPLETYEHPGQIWFINKDHQFRDTKYVFDISTRKITVAK